MLKGLSHVAMWVTDIDRALDFFLKIPGIEEQFRLSKEDGTPWLIYLRVAPRQFIELFPASEGEYKPSKNAGYAHVCLEVDDVQEMYRSVVEQGIVPHGEPKLGADGSWQFWINDPDGNPIEFHQFTEDSMQIK